MTEEVQTQGISERITDNLGNPVSSCTHEQLLRLVETMYTLLDDIDTLSDIYKPSDEKSYKVFYEHALKLANMRHNSIVTDGFGLYLPKP